MASKRIIPDDAPASQPKPHSQQTNNQDSFPTTDADAETKDSDLDAITDAIVLHSRNIEDEYLEIGKLLNEAKKKMPHGFWLVWLQRNIDIRVGTAQRLMRIAKEFSNNSPVTHLGFTKVSILLTLPESERDTIVDESHIINGILKSASDMTKREFEEVVRQRKLQIANKLKSVESKPDDDQLPSPAEFKRSSEEMLDLNGTLKSLASFMQTLLGNITAITDDTHKRDELTAALRGLCEDTLQSIENTELTIS